MNHCKITFANGDTINTDINGTDEEVLKYYAIGRYFNLGQGDKDNMQKVVKCEIMKPMKGLHLNIYTPGYNCSNNGITATAKGVTLVGPGIVELNEASPEYPAVHVVTRNLGGKYGDNWKHLEPVYRPSGIGWMFGGCFAYSSDSRYPFAFPLKIHDRQE